MPDETVPVKSAGGEPSGQVSVSSSPVPAPEDIEKLLQRFDLAARLDEQARCDILERGRASDAGQLADTTEHWYARRSEILSLVSRLRSQVLTDEELTHIHRNWRPVALCQLCRDIIAKLDSRLSSDSDTGDTKNED